MKRSKYSRRIRKKKRLGEFTETGFLLYLYCGEDKEEFISDSLIDILNKMGAGFAGGGDPLKYSFFVDRYRKAITEEERDTIINEAKNIPGVSHVIALDLVNIWYSNVDDYFEKADKIVKEYEREKEI
jgi:uncharacterized protein YggL (DUF469 family)